MRDAERARLSAFGHRIRRLREERGLTMVELADKIAVTDGYIRLMENGHRIPSVEVLERLADALEVSTDVLLRGRDIHAWEQVARLEAAARMLRRVDLSEVGIGRGTVTLMVVGQVPASATTWRWGREREYRVSVPVDYLAGHSQDEVIAVVASGDGLTGLLIGDGDVLVCARPDRQPPRPGSTVIARVDDEETCVRWQPTADGRVTLVDGDGAVRWCGYPEQARVEGVVLSVLRRLS